MRIFLLLISLLLLGMSEPASETNVTRSGQDYALFFAVNAYQHLDPLNNPISNANDIAAELRDQYGFQTEVVENPTMDDIDRKLAEYKQQFASGGFAQNGQLFIYFSGHGIYQGGNGYFMTRNADPDRPQRTAMEYDYYRNYIDGIPCQHIMVTIDACHSASFDPRFGSRSDRRFGRPGEASFDRVLANHDALRTRVFWTSDATNGQTPDQSNFAYHLLEGLRSHRTITGYTRSSELFTLYLEQAAPQPGGGRFGNDEPEACFLFFHKDKVEVVDSFEEQLWVASLNQDTEEGYQFYLQSYPEGRFSESARAEIMSIKRQQAERERALAAQQERKRQEMALAEQRLQDQEAQKIKDQLVGDLFGSSPHQTSNTDSSGDPGPEELTNSGHIGSRRVIHSAPITENSQKVGTVKIELCVDQKGNVIPESVSYLPNGSTTDDHQLVNAAIKNAKLWKFEPGVIERECSIITYNFKIR